MNSTKAAIFQDAYVFDVDPQTGFMPSAVPLSRLPCQWEIWEATLEEAVASKLQVGDKPEVTAREKAVSEAWRARVRDVSFALLFEIWKC